MTISIVVDGDNQEVDSAVPKDAADVRNSQNLEHQDLVCPTPVKERTLQVNYQEYQLSQQKTESNRLFKSDIENRITNMKECDEPDFKIA